MSATDISHLVDCVLIDCEMLTHSLSSTLNHLPQFVNNFPSRKHKAQAVGSFHNFFLIVSVSWVDLSLLLK